MHALQIQRHSRVCYWLVLGVLGVFLQQSFAQTTPTARYSTVADMAASRIPTSSNTQISALVTGRLTSNDGGGGVFFYVPGSVLATNDYSVFPSTGTGRWIRQQGSFIDQLWLSSNRDLGFVVPGPGSSSLQWSNSVFGIYTGNVFLSNATADRIAYFDSNKQLKSTSLTPSSLGTVTSVGMTAPNGFTVTGSPVTGSGTLVLSGGPIEIGAACSDETTPITTGNGKVTFRSPKAFTLTAVRASLTTAQASGSIFTVNIKQNGSSVLSTKITIDNGATTSTTATTPPVISTSAITDDSVITVDVDQVGNGTATGLKVWLIGTR